MDLVPRGHSCLGELACRAVSPAKRRSRNRVWYGVWAIPSRLQSLAIECSPRGPLRPIRIFSSAEYRSPVVRRSHSHAFQRGFLSHLRSRKATMSKNPPLVWPRAVALSPSMWPNSLLGPSRCGWAIELFFRVTFSRTAEPNIWSIPWGQKTVGPKYL